MKTRLAQLLILVLGLWPCALIQAAQKITSLTASAKGKGTITISDSKKHDITSIVVKLKEDGEAEIILVTDIQLFVQARWTAPEDISKGIALKITGGIVSGNADGSGTLFLRSDSKSIEKLTFKAKGRDGSEVIVEFTADEQSPH